MISCLYSPLCGRQRCLDIYDQLSLLSTLWKTVVSWRLWSAVCTLHFVEDSGVLTSMISCLCSPLCGRQRCLDVDDQLSLLSTLWKTTVSWRLWSAVSALHFVEDSGVLTSMISCLCSPLCGRQRCLDVYDQLSLLSTLWKTAVSWRLSSAVSTLHFVEDSGVLTSMISCLCSPLCGRQRCLDVYDQLSLLFTLWKTAVSWHLWSAVSALHFVEDSGVLTSMISCLCSPLCGRQRCLDIYDQLSLLSTLWKTAVSWHLWSAVSALHFVEDSSVLTSMISCLCSPLCGRQRCLDVYDQLSLLSTLWKTAVSWRLWSAVSALHFVEDSGVLTSMISCLYSPLCGRQRCLDVYDQLSLLSTLWKTVVSWRLWSAVSALHFVEDSGVLTSMISCLYSSLCGRQRCLDVYDQLSLLSTLWKTAVSWRLWSAVSTLHFVEDSGVLTSMISCLYSPLCGRQRCLDVYDQLSLLSTLWKTAVSWRLWSAVSTLHFVEDSGVLTSMISCLCSPLCGRQRCLDVYDQLSLLSTLWKTAVSWRLWSVVSTLHFVEDSGVLTSMISCLCSSLCGRQRCLDVDDQLSLLFTLWKTAVSWRLWSAVSTLHFVEDSGVLTSMISCLCSPLCGRQQCLDVYDQLSLLSTLWKTAVSWRLWSAVSALHFVEDSGVLTSMISSLYSPLCGRQRCLDVYDQLSLLSTLWKTAVSWRLWSAVSALHFVEDSGVLTSMISSLYSPLCGRQRCLDVYDQLSLLSTLWKTAVSWRLWSAVSTLHFVEDSGVLTSMISCLYSPLCGRQWCLDVYD